MDPVMQENAALPQEQSTSIEQPKQNNFLVMLLSIMLLLSVSIAGFFAYQTQTLVKELTLLKSSPIPLYSAEPTLDPTADWKTYNDEKNRFSFSYPEEVEVKKENGRTSLYLKGFDYPLSLIPEAPHNWGEGLAKDQLDKIYTKSFQYPDNPSRNMYSDSSVLFVIEFRTANDKDQSKEYLSKFDQILSTFKFTESDPTVDWKTYNMNRIDFKYPQNYFIEPQSSKSNVTIFNKNTGSDRYYISVREIGGSLQQLVQTGSINKDQLTDVKIPFPEKGFYVVKEMRGTALPVGVSEKIYLIDQVNSYIEIRFWNNAGTLNTEYELFRNNVDLILSSLSFKG